MEDKVPFKTCTYLKDQVKPEVRRFGIEKSVVTSFCYLDAKLREIYPRLKQKHYTVSWIDEEGDDVTISSDEEMIVALTAMRENLIKLNVYCTDQKLTKDIDCDIVVTTTTEGASGINNLPHCGVICDNCDAEVVGFRYKCTSCADFDLCSKCESAGHHAEHIMVRLPMPNMPRTTIRRAMKQSRHIMKAVESTMMQEFPNKKQRRNRSNEKKRHHSPHGEGNHHDRCQRHRHPRSSWLETFATYINEIANLAGDIDTEIDKSKDTTPKPAKPEPTNVENKDNNVGVKKTPEAEMSVTSDTSSENKVTINDNKKDESPERVPDDWTVINKEKDLMESDGEASTQVNPPDGLNLPEEFQKHVNISEGQNLYPPLHAASAVLNPKEPEQMTSQGPAEPKVIETVKQKITPSNSKARPQPQQSQPTRSYHNDPHIDAAIKQMLGMGFTNDGDWLTQLLESTNGNIASVLELLTPVNPKK